MSWSFTVPDSSVEEFEATAKTAAETTLTYGQDTAEVREQIDLAITKATSIVHSGAIGEGKVRASLSGHANAGHQNPTESWANEMVTVSVSNANTSTPSA